MSRSISPRITKILVLSAGLLGLLLRFVLLQTGVDEKGLLVTGHWASSASWLLTTLSIVLIVIGLGQCSGPAAYGESFPASILRCAGSIVAACGILSSGTPAVTSPGLTAAEPVLRILAAAALVAVAYCRLRGKKPPFPFHGAVCLYLALRMVCRYQVWSSDPQLQHYAFYLGAHVALMLAAYQLTAFDADSGNHRKLWGWCLAAMFLCLTALPGSEEPFFLLCASFWMFTGLSSLTAVKGD